MSLSVLEFRKGIRRMGTLAHRAAHDVRDDVWHDVWFGIAVLLLSTLLGVLVFGLPWDKLVLASILAFVLIPVGAFLYHFGRTLHRPDRHRSWERRRFDFVPLAEGKQAPGIFTVEIAPLKPTYVSRNMCEITDPDGNVWKEAEGEWPERPELMRGSLRAEYPRLVPRRAAAQIRRLPNTLAARGRPEAMEGNLALLRDGHASGGRVMPGGAVTVRPGDYLDRRR